MRYVGVVLGLLLPSLVSAQTSRPPIIDMHLHALPATWFGAPPQRICLHAAFPPVDPGIQPADLVNTQDCPRPLPSPMTDEAVMRETLEIMERYNVIGVASGPDRVVRIWHDASPERIIPGTFTSWGANTDIDSLRARIVRGEIEMVGEVTTQYGGSSAGDIRFEPYWQLAEQLDVPLSIHVGLGPPGAPYVGSARYRAGLSSALHLEEALIRHPNVRVNVMHAGWPLLDDMLAVLYSHPQVYVDLGVISFVLPRPEFYRYLRALVEAGFGERILFGSDQMIWPGALEEAIQTLEGAAFLSEQQLRDIFYNNAARFLRLDAN